MKTNARCLWWDIHRLRDGVCLNKDNFHCYWSIKFSVIVTYVNYGITKSIFRVQWYWISRWNSLILRASGGLSKLCNPFYAPHILIYKHIVKKKWLQFHLLIGGWMFCRVGRYMYHESLNHVIETVTWTFSLPKYFHSEDGNLCKVFGDCFIAWIGQGIEMWLTGSPHEVSKYTTIPPYF